MLQLMEATLWAEEKIPKLGLAIKWPLASVVTFNASIAGANLVLELVEEQIM